MCVGIEDDKDDEEVFFDFNKLFFRELVFAVVNEDLMFDMRLGAVPERSSLNQLSMMYQALYCSERERKREEKKETRRDSGREGKGEKVAERFATQK